MYCSTFTFAKGEYDDQFFSLDNAISQVAKSIDGYAGEEAWSNTEDGLLSNTYYWHTMEALQQLISHPLHIQAKQQQAKWLRGYQVVISKVLGTYGSTGMQHPLAGHAMPLDAAIGR
ncbi:antibiotic biosynthesis monooxygenase family protein [Herbaspirillum robiniae]|uniref:Antibiotic biosynthesis monooxygenase n=1 Tax=Herbaspirillum robiniae TaxID=2014887 RepID=A0A246WRG0_9BURK|nr:antibiotic biosynthesis monooxygenase [Herbaspirillum robiniae]OWY28200.1 antibiotic biosynthesis monooxygenase [Herbaspirillum robiniae]